MSEGGRRGKEDWHEEISAQTHREWLVEEVLVHSPEGSLKRLIAHWTRVEEEEEEEEEKKVTLIAACV